MGRATATALAASGARVALLDQASSQGKEVAEELGGVFVACDVTDFPGTEAALKAAVDALGSLHIAVNTAGGGTAKRTLTREGPHDLDAFRWTVDLNLVGTFNLNRLQAWHMSQNEPEDEERGVIINTASIAAFEGQIGPGPWQPRHQGAGHRAQPVRDGRHGRLQRGARRSDGARRGLPAADGTARGVRQARAGHRGQPHAEWPVPAAGRRSAVRP
jgi:NAD(P)-dependent dehydrogenase (short-subunit alcohol dehydrogenase family)